MWLFYALSAAILWGLTYALDEQIFKHISVVTSLLIASFFACIFLAIVGYATGTLQKDFTTLSSSRTALLLVSAGVLTFVTAEVMIGFAIFKKNATLAALIEISYPFFVVLFSTLLFQEQHLSLPVIIGGILIFAEVGLITVFAL